MALKNLKRPRVYIPPFEEVAEIPDPDKEKVWITFGDRERWLKIRNRLIDAAVNRLAEEAEADPAELMKVKHLLVEVKENMPPGRPKMTAQQYLHISSLIDFDGMTQKQACKDARVDTKTYRTADNYWRDYWAEIRAVWKAAGIKWVNEEGKTID